MYDTVKNSAVHFSEIRLTPRLKRNVRAARMRYQLHLEDQRKLTAESEKAGKRKVLQDKIRSLESRRKLLKESVASMSQEADAVTARTRMSWRRGLARRNGQSVGPMITRLCSKRPSLR